MKYLFLLIFTLITFSFVNGQELDQKLIDLQNEIDSLTQVPNVVPNFFSGLSFDKPVRWE